MPSFAKFGNDLYTGRRSYDIVGKRNMWYAIAVLIVIVSSIGLFTPGLNSSIEFRGGSEFRVSNADNTSEITGQRAVTDVKSGANVRVSVVGDNGVRVQTEKLTDSETGEVKKSLAEAFNVPEDDITSSFVGATWGRDVSKKALNSLLVFTVLVALFIALYFRTWKMALAALVALAHDLIATVGIYAIIGFEVSPASVIGFLTILGYSLYDTVVVFDKVRENTDHITATTKRTYGEAANKAVNQTLVRSINTSVVALLPVAAILFIGSLLLGAGTLKDISLALFIGMLVGTYSSIFIATPILVHLRQGEPELADQAARVHKKRVEKGLREDVEPLNLTDAPSETEPVAAGVGSRPQASDTTTVPSARLRPGSGKQRTQPRRGGRKK
jgi:preprotein translocase subunit SecF